MASPRVCLNALRGSARRPDTRFWRDITGRRVLPCAPYSTDTVTEQHEAFRRTPSNRHKTQWPSRSKYTRISHGSQGQSHEDPAVGPDPDSSTGEQFARSQDARAKRIRTTLGRAIETMNLSRTEQLYSEFNRLLESSSDQLSNSIIRGTFEHFMLAFFKLRWENMALHAWNMMIKHSCAPTVSSWSIMLKGCQWDRDHTRMEQMWHRMRASGVQPDLVAWSTRIYGLFRHQRPHIGLMALEEMSQEWRSVARQNSGGESSQGAIDGVHRPDTRILNSALSGLSARDRDQAPRILAWARDLQIEPDVSTYNTLLQHALSRNDPKRVAQILQTMKERNVGPDAATSTIMLNDFFRADKLSDLSQDAQTSVIMSTIQTLETGDVKIDDRGYALVVDRLLKQFNNLPAALKVLAHMTRDARQAGQPVRYTPHIYTILMTYYFQLDPPDLDATEGLWRMIASSKDYAEQVDVIFYDRMIEGYARHGDRGRMMAFLTKMGAEGKRPGWLAMTAVVECLAQHGDWERIKEIVHDAQFGGGLLKAGMRGTKGQADFWALISSFDLRNATPRHS